MAVGGYLAWNVSTQRSADISNIKQLEASLQDQSAKLAGLQREASDQAKVLDELRNEIQRRTNEAAEAKEQLAQREAELEETRVQLSQRGGARTVGIPQDELATLLRIPNVKAVSLTGSDMAKRAAGLDRKSTRLNSSHIQKSRMPSSA